MNMPANCQFFFSAGKTFDSDDAGMICEFPIRLTISCCFLGGCPMNQIDTRTRILEILTSIAPEADPARIEGAIPFRQQFMFDSVDFLSFAIKLQEAFGLPIPETDFPMLSTLDGCLDYISAHAQ
jgi:acyl carrier protein